MVIKIIGSNMKGKCLVANNFKYINTEHLKCIIGGVL